MAIHLVPISRLGSSGLPIRNVRTTLDCLTLLLAGVYLAAHVSMNTGGLLHHPFTCFLTQDQDVYFLLHLPSPPVAGSSYSEAPCPAEFGLSSLPMTERPFYQPQLFFYTIPKLQYTTTWTGYNFFIFFYFNYYLLIPPLYFKLNFCLIHLFYFKKVTILI